MKLKTLRFQTPMELTKFCVFPMGVRPLPAGYTRRQKLIRDIVFFFALNFSVAQICSAFYAMYDTPNIPNIAEGVPEMLSVIAIVGKLFLCKANQESIQTLFDEMEEFMAQMSDEDDELFQSCLQRPLYIHFSHTIFCYVTAVIFLAMPAKNHENLLPTLTKYPFSVDATSTWTTMLIFHCYMVTLDACSVNLDSCFLLLLWSVVGRFELLARDFTRVKSVLDLERCIAKQQYLIDYSERLLNILRWPALSANSMNVIVAILGGLFLINNSKLQDATAFLFFIAVAMSALFLFTYAGEYLASSSSNIVYATYSSEWFGASNKMLRSMQLVMQRSAIPIIIQMDGILPVLNNELYGNSVSAIFSYIATLRAITMD